MITLRKALPHTRATSSTSLGFLKKHRQLNCPECRPGQAPGPHVAQLSAWCPTCERVWRYFKGQYNTSSWYHEIPATSAQKGQH